MTPSPRLITMTLSGDTRSGPKGNIDCGTASVNVKNTFFFAYLNLLSIICRLFVIV